MATITETEYEVNANIIGKSLPPQNTEKETGKNDQKPQVSRVREVLQLAAVIHHVFVWVLLPITSMWVPFYILFGTSLWWTMVLYFGWYVYDFRTPAKGSRKWVSFVYGFC